MPWRDSDHPYDDDPANRFGRPGGDWQGVRPTFDNPMSWSLRLFRALGTTVRAHVILFVYILIQLGRSLQDDSALGLGPAAIMMACLFLVVLVHEFGHVLACRWQDGHADEILMWPLGGLAFCQPRNDWYAHFITAIGGPMVNVVLFIILAPVLGLVTGNWLGVALPNPLGIDLSLATIDGGGRQPWWLLSLYLLHAVSFFLLLFNLLPIFPLDGGRIAQALLWPRMGYSNSMRYAVYAGYIGAIFLGVGGAIIGQWMLIAVAIFGGLTCWQTLRQVKYTDEVMGFSDAGDPYAASLWGDPDEGDEPQPAGAPPEPNRREQKAAERDRKKQQEEADQIDAILAKIARDGIESLSRDERKRLEEATERRRQQD